MDGKTYKQCDGVSMGSPLGVTFANFYMTHVENQVLTELPDIKPLIYCRYVDDCFLVVDHTSKIPEIIQTFEQRSVLYISPTKWVQTDTMIATRRLPPNSLKL